MPIIRSCLSLHDPFRSYHQRSCRASDHSPQGIQLGDDCVWTSSNLKLHLSSHQHKTSNRGWSCDSLVYFDIGMFPIRVENQAYEPKPTGNRSHPYGPMHMFTWSWDVWSITLLRRRDWQASKHGDLHCTLFSSTSCKSPVLLCECLWKLTSDSAFLAQLAGASSAAGKDTTRDKVLRGKLSCRVCFVLGED